MIEITNADKYFNRHKKNELHVINNTSLKIGDNGLVALLGSSGSGKTTLLNSIGGLDKLKKGKILINGKLISSKLASRVDNIRNLNVGYIFQDYKLIDNMTVYENVALVLKMIGIKDKNEVKTRVEYVLDKVGMLRYKRRPASMLSGGERQRVAIARAIVKDPNIILADEPTGNLDSKNSLEIMKIIKAISKDRLVILVTHEVSLAKFYATRIIEIVDGKIEKDYTNDNNDTLDYEIDNSFYLKDFKYHDNIKKDMYEIDLYKEDKSKINIDIIVKNNNIYIRSNTTKKIEVVDDNSNIEIINDNYKQINKEDIDKYNFDFKEKINSNIKKKYSSIFNPLTMITAGFKKVFDYSVIKKILLLGFILSGMFITYATSTILANVIVKDEEFIQTNENYLTIIKKKTTVEEYNEYEKVKGINYIMPGDSLVTFNVNFNDYYQTNGVWGELTGSLSSIEMINKDDLVLGRMPEDDYEIVVDKLVINRLINHYNEPKMAGITSYKDLLNRKLNMGKMNQFTIVGITDKSSPSIYTNENMFVNIIDNSGNEEEGTFYDYNLFTDKITLSKGRMPEADYEVIVNSDSSDEMPLNKEISYKINDKKLIVVGYYTSKYDIDYYLVSNNTIKMNLIATKGNITVYPIKKNASLKDYRELNLNIKDSYVVDKETYINDNSEITNANIIVAVIIIAISLIEMFLMIRASFLSRIKEVGIYRAIGVKKKDIYIMFTGEILALTTLACVPGIVFMAYILYKITLIEYFPALFIVDYRVVILSIIFIYLFNLIIGLLPIYNVIRKTPAQILSRHDLD